MALRHADVSVQEMADELGLNRGSLSRWLNDKGTPPRGGFIKLWALRTGVPYQWLLTGADPRPGEPVKGAGEGVARPERFELPTFWLVASTSPTSEESQRDDVVVPFRRLEPVGAAA